MSPLTFSLLLAAAVAFVQINGHLIYSMVAVTKDFGDFYRSAKAFVDGSAMYASNTNLNPPHFHLLLLPLTPLPVRAAYVVWLLVSGACLFQSLRAIARELEIRTTMWRVWVTTVAVICSAATTGLIVTGQVTWLLMVPMTYAWIAARRQQWLHAGMLIGLLVSMKSFLAIMLPYLVLARRWRALAASFAAAAVAFALGFAVFGVHAYAEWYRVTSGIFWTFLPMNMAVYGVLTRLFAPSVHSPYAPLAAAPAFVQPLWLVAAALLGLVTVLRLPRGTSPADVDRSFALLTLAALLISPLGWLYYVWLALGPLVAVTRGALADPLRRRLLIAAAFGLYVPVPVATSLQPNAWASLTLGSVYAWCALMAWTALLVPSRADSNVVRAVDAAVTMDAVATR